MYLKEDPRNDVFYYGKIFFFGFGVFYLIKIAFDFSKDVPEVSHVLLGWAFLAISLGFYRPVVKKIGKFIPENYTGSKFKIIRTVGFIASSCFAIIGIPFILPSVIDVKFDPKLVSIFGVTGLIIGFLLLVIELILIKKWSTFQRTN